MSGIEFGARVGSIRLVEADTKSQQTPPERKLDTHLGKIITGYATLYNQEHEFKGQTEIFTPGCFDESIRLGMPVAFRLDHDESKTLSTNKDRLELVSDQVGLAFRFWPSSSREHQSALRDVAEGKRRECSVGYAVLRDSFLSKGGCQIRLIHEAALADVSIGQKAVVQGTYAILIDPNSRPSLLEETKSGSLLRAISIWKPINELRDRIASS
jgi:HK97 family phage prohead protease